MLALVTTPNSAAPVELHDVREPQPAPNEALVEVRAFSLNRGELRLFQIRPEGWAPGQDISGVVVQSAANGSGPKAGARVVALTDNAGWAQYAAVPAHRMAVLPDNVRFEDAAALPVAGLTALRTLRHGAPLLGKRVLVTGAAGGVGHLATQLAPRSGARVTAVVSSAERGRHLRGADEIVEGIDKAQGQFALILESAGGPPSPRRSRISRQRERSSFSATRRASRRRSAFAIWLSTRMRAFKASPTSRQKPRSALLPIWHYWSRSSAMVH